MTSDGSTERWARFLEDQSPGLTWLAATLLEWGELPPFARRAWRVTVQTSRSGDVVAVGAFQEETGLLAVAAKQGVPPPFLGEPERVKRLVGPPEDVEAVFVAVPMLLLRRTPGIRRQVFAYDGEAPQRHPALSRADPDSTDALEAFRQMAGGGEDPFTAPELLGPVQRGQVWVLESELGLGAMFRVEGVARRRVQITDVCVHPRLRGQGLGASLLRSAANVARTEYARGAAIAVPAGDAADRTARRAEFTPAGLLDDVHLA